MATKMVTCVDEIDTAVQVAVQGTELKWMDCI